MSAAKGRPEGRPLPRSRCYVPFLAFVAARHEPEFLAHAILNRLIDVRILAQELLRVFTALTETLAGVRKPRAALFDDALVDREVEEIAGFGNPFAVHDVELGFPEGRCDLVLHHLDA